jgi:hypothetical protein
MTGDENGAGGQQAPDLAALAQARLQASTTSPRHQPLHPVVAEAKKKFYTVLEDELLDYKCVLTNLRWQQALRKLGTIA